MEEVTEKQGTSKDKRLANLLPHQWKKGQSGNVHGRPKGKTMKEWAREYLERLTDEERDAFMEGIPKEVIWKMSEGNPETKTDITSDGEKIVFMPTELLNKNGISNPNTKPSDNSQ